MQASIARGRVAEIVVPFPVPREKIAQAVRVRSTLLASSLRSLKDHGHYERYLEKLDPTWRDGILEAVAGVWLPIEAAIAHYHACNELGLTPHEQFDIGREVGDRVQGTFLAAMVRTAKSAGVTPWNALPYTGRLYERLFEGGGIEVTKMGPKEALCELAQNPVTSIPYFRNGIRGIYTVATELFCSKAYVQDMTRLGTATSCVLKISWA